MKTSARPRPINTALPRILFCLLAMGLAARLPAQTYTNLSGDTPQTGNAVTLNNTADSTYEGVLTATTSINKTGAGTITMTGTVNVIGNNSGAFQVNAGTVIFAQSATLSTINTSILANEAVNSGTLVFKDSSMWTGYQLTLARGGPGMLEITDNAKVSLRRVSMVNIANATISSTLKISGHGELTLTEYFQMSANTLTAYPVTATVEISDYGRMTYDHTTNNNLWIGNGAAMTATFTVKDHGEFISRTNGGMRIGYQGGTGYLNIEDYGHVQSTVSYIGLDGNANTPTTMGVVTVGGTGGRWDITAGFTISSGSLIIKENGRVTSTTAASVVGGGLAAVRTGHAVVGGQGLWETAALNVGNNAGATGILEIKESGSVSTTGAVIVGNPANSNGRIIVSGSNALWTAGGGAFNVGASGTGRMEISGGGIVRTGTVTIASTGSGNGAVTLSGNAADGRGVLETNSIIRTGGTSSLVFDGGVLRVQSANNNVIAGNLAVTLLGEGAFIDTNGFELVFGRSFDGAGGFNKTGDGVLTLTGANTYTGVTGVHGGTLVLPHSAAISSGTIVTGGDGVLDIGYGGDLTQDFIGAGGTVLLRHNHALTGDNSGFAGRWAISGTVAAAAARNIGDGDGIDLAPSGLLTIINSDPAGLTLGGRLGGGG
ncbi:MAG: autotransporter-associated beta strand repeat-containing protein, partial [Opitutaceae bacterium]|nr:autotransporter-associated beta strand repeat-containing protein [Opitutaceae bacterium]